MLAAVAGRADTTTACHRGQARRGARPGCLDRAVRPVRAVITYTEFEGQKKKILEG
jgi:hypothetical protein